MQDLYKLYNQLQNGSRLDATIPRSTGMPFWDSFNAGFSVGNKVQNNLSDKRNNKRMAKDADQIIMKHLNGGQQNPNTASGQWNRDNQSGVMYSGRQTQKPSGFSIQGRQGVDFPEMQNNVTKMGNLYNTSSEYVPDYNSVVPTGGIGVNENGVYGISAPSVANFPRKPSDFGRALQSAEQPQNYRYGENVLGLKKDGVYFPMNSPSPIQMSYTPEQLAQIQEYGKFTPEELKRMGAEQLIQRPPTYRATQSNGYVPTQPNAVVPRNDVFIPEVNMREEQAALGGYTPFEPDYIGGEGTAEDIRKFGQTMAQNEFRNAKANRAGAAEFQRGYNPQGGHSKDPSLYYFTNTIPSLINRKPEYLEDYKNVPQIGDY